MKTFTLVCAALAGVSNAYWMPTAGMTWNIALKVPIQAPYGNVAVLDTDVFDTPNATIADMRSKGYKVICYFSAGSYEAWRPDANKFQKSDIGTNMTGWDENWINIRSTNVRNIMAARMDLAAAKGCDAVDPDNMDGYENDDHGGFNLKPSDSINYMQFLSSYAHSKNLSIGLKNALQIIPSVVNITEFAVNESCEQYNECNKEQPYIKANKPVFHIEYVNPYPPTADQTDSICSNKIRQGFSTVIKDDNLHQPYTACSSNSTFPFIYPNTTTSNSGFSTSLAAFSGANAVTSSPRLHELILVSGAAVCAMLFFSSQ